MSGVGPAQLLERSCVLMALNPNLASQLMDLPTLERWQPLFVLPNRESKYGKHDSSTVDERF